MPIKCSECGQDKEPERYDAYCKPCRAKYNKAYKLGQLKGGKKRNSKYSLFTPEEKLALFEFQGHRCGICNREFDTIDQLVVDHDHETGDTRGLLCSRCNQGLGFFRDDLMYLSAAMSYLENWPRDLKDLAESDRGKHS